MCLAAARDPLKLRDKVPLKKDPGPRTGVRGAWLLGGGKLEGGHTGGQEVT